jgi:hypothetical protein
MKEIQNVTGTHKSLSGAWSLQEHVGQSRWDNFYCTLKEKQN